MVSIFRRQLRQKSDPSPRRVIATRLCRFFDGSGGLRFPARAFLGLAAAKILPQRPGQALVAVTVFPCFVTFVSPAHNSNYLPGRNPRKAGHCLASPVGLVAVSAAFAPFALLRVFCCR